MSRKYLTHNEVQQLLAAAMQGRHAARDVCLMYMSYLHGFRVSEIIALKVSDIDLAGDSVYVQRLKNGLSTRQPLQPLEKQILARWLQVREAWRDCDSDRLFLSQLRPRLSRQQVYRMLRRYGELAGIDIVVHPHMLRHACGYSLADNGCDTRLIQDYLGHRNIHHTVRYTASNVQRFQGIWSGRMAEDAIQ